MTTRREFLGTTAGALAGLAFVGCDLLAAAPALAQAQRRQVVDRRQPRILRRRHSSRDAAGD